MAKDTKQMISDVLLRAYETLKFSPEEAKNALNDLAGLQQMAIMTELMKDLTKEEVAGLNKNFPSKSDEDKKKEVEYLFKNRYSEEEFKNKIETTIKKVLDDHLAYLKSRGNEQVDQILAEIS